MNNEEETVPEWWEDPNNPPLEFDEEITLTEDDLPYFLRSQNA